MRVSQFQSGVLLATLLLVFLVVWPSPAPAQSGDGSAARDELATATDEFNYGNFLNALSIVNRLTAGGELSGDDLRDAFALQARCEAELGNRANARNAFCEVIRIDSGWRPNPSLYTSSEKAIFEEALAECKPEGGGRNKWYLIGGGAAAAVLIAILAGGSGGDDGGGNGNGNGTTTLPDFPDPPAN